MQQQLQCQTSNYCQDRAQVPNQYLQSTLSSKVSEQQRGEKWMYTKEKGHFPPKLGSSILWKKVTRDMQNPGNHTLFGPMTKKKYLGSLLHVKGKSLCIFLLLFQ